MDERLQRALKRERRGEKSGGLLWEVIAFPDSLPNPEEDGRERVFSGKVIVENIWAPRMVLWKRVSMLFETAC